MTEDYDTILEIVAENPGINREKFVRGAADHDISERVAVELLEQAVDTEDVLEFGGRHWVMRKGRFSFDRYDHPET